MFSNDRGQLLFGGVLCVALVAFTEGTAPGGLIGTDASLTDNSTLYGVNQNIGGYLTIGTTGQLLMSGLAYDANTLALYGATNGDRLYVINEFTGSATEVGTGGLGFDVASIGMAFDTNNDTLYLTDAATDSLYTLDVTTGDAQKQGNTSVDDIVGLGYAPGTSTLYGVSGPDSTSSLYTLTSNGTATLLGSLGITLTGNSVGLTFDPVSDTLYMSNFGTLYSVNTSTGAADSIGATGVSNIPGLASSYAPEPSTLHFTGLLSCCVAGYAWRQRRSRRSRSTRSA